MNLFVTTAPNDVDLVKALGESVIRCPIPCGDVCFWGVGEDDTALKIACERKKTGDFASCILDGRLMYQAQRAKEEGIDVFCVVVEGRIHCSDEDGLLEVPVWKSFINVGGYHKRREEWEPVRPAMTYSRFTQFLTELQYLAGIIVMRSENVHETAAVVRAVYDNFQTPPSKHNSLHHIFEPPNRDSVLLTRPGLVRRVSKEFAGVGWTRSRAVAEHFKTVRAMVNAGIEDWLEVDGIGKKTAEKVVQEIGGDASKI